MGQLSNISAMDYVKKGLFAILFAALPWMGLFRLSTFLFAILGFICLLSGWKNINTRQFLKDPLLLLFISFYALQWIGFFIDYKNPFNVFSLEQKASFLLVPFLFTMLFDQVKDLWLWGIKGFIVGVALALIFCLAKAVKLYLISYDVSLFFYHEFSKSIGSNAIYFSLYVCVAMFSLLYYFQQKTIQFSFGVFIFLMLFFYGALLLLSSKMLILIGSVLLVLLILFKVHSVRWKQASVFSIILSLLLVFILKNPIKERFAQVHYEKYEVVLHTKDFTNYPFTGLDLRLQLWRMGFEMLNENQLWIFGNSGRRYHDAFNEKIKAYKMYSGKTGTDDTGYLNYDLHNQYVEN